MKPQNLAESIIWYSIIGSYGIYALGLLYPYNAALAWILLACLAIPHLRQPAPVHWSIWVWVGCMGMTFLATYFGIEEAKLGNNFLLRGILGYLSTSAVLGLFFLASSLKIRPQLIYRAVCILCIQSLAAIPILYLAYLAGLPEILYTSPIERLIQNGPIFYNVGLYLREVDSQQIRFFLFAPWCPALGLVSNVYFFLVLQEKQRLWKYLGIIGAIAMNVVSVSRAALVSLPAVLLVVWFMENLRKPQFQISIGIVSFLAGIFSTNLVNALTLLSDRFTGSRASSSLVRYRLARIASERWTEAAIWGHGVQEPGPKIVANMPIGSHHTWLGLLFTKGIMGFCLLILPIGITVFELVKKAQHNSTAKAGLSVLLTLILFSFGEQIDILAYLYYPGIIIMAIALQEPHHLVRVRNE